MDPSVDNVPTGTPTGEGAPSGNDTPQYSGPEWLADYPEDLRGSKSLQKFKDPQALAQSYLNAERLLGREKIPMPKTDEEFMDVYRRLGAPEKAEDYGFSLDGVQDQQLRGIVEKDLSWFGEVAAKAGLSKKQATMILEGYVSKAGDGMRAYRDNEAYETQQGLNQLRAEFGVAGADQKMTLATRAARHYMSDELFNAVTQSPVGRNPEFIKFLAKLGEEHAEEIGIDRSGATAVSPKDLLEEITKAQADPAYLDASHPEHQRVVKRVQSLYEQLTRN